MNITQNEVALFSDDDIEKLSQWLFDERRKRLDARIDRGEFQPPNDDELKLLESGMTDAIRAYRTRVGEQAVSLFAAHRIFSRLKNKRAA